MSVDQPVRRLPILSGRQTDKGCGCMTNRDLSLRCPSRLHKTPFMNSRCCCNDTDDRCAVLKIDTCKRQRENEQQRSGHLVYHGMHRQKRFLTDIPNRDIRRLYKCDNGDPYTEPYRNIQYRQQFYEASRSEYDIRSRIELCTECADRTGFPCHSAVDHIGDSGSDIQRIECR